jgi:hypothetical protein
MPVVMSPNPRRIRVFIDKYGNKKEGGIDENMGGYDMGGATSSNRIPGVENKEKAN